MCLVFVLFCVVCLIIFLGLLCFVLRKHKNLHTNIHAMFRMLRRVYIVHETYQNQGFENLSSQAKYTTDNSKSYIPPFPPASLNCLMQKGDKEGKVWESILIK